MNKSKNLMPSCFSPNGLVAVDEVVYRRQLYYNCGGDGGCCPPRRSQSDLNVNGPRCGPCHQQSTLKLSSSPNVRCSPCNRSVVPPHNTPCSSPYLSPRGGPMNTTSNSSRMLLAVPKMVNRSRSASSLDDHEYDGRPLSSTRMDSKISMGQSDFFMGSGSVSRIYRN